MVNRKVIKNNKRSTISRFINPSFFGGATAPQWARAPSFTRFLYHTQRRATVGRTPLDEWSAPSQRPVPDNTRQSQQTNIHAPAGIRTHNLSRRAAANRAATGTGLLTRISNENDWKFNTWSLYYGKVECRAGTCWIGDWVSPRTGLETLMNKQNPAHERLSQLITLVAQSFLLENRDSPWNVVTSFADRMLSTQTITAWLCHLSILLKVSDLKRKEQRKSQYSLFASKFFWPTNAQFINHTKC
jgi:hypothetical protein